MQFKRMYSKEPVDLGSYLKQVFEDDPRARFHVGCDSQNYSNVTVYVTTVVVRYPGSGARVVYQKEKKDKITDMWSRLWRELEKSVEVALYIENECGLKVHQLDLDYNEDPSYPSNKVLKAAGGYVSSLGFPVKAKPGMLMATWAANVLCH